MRKILAVLTVIGLVLIVGSALFPYRPQSIEDANAIAAGQGLVLFITVICGITYGVTAIVSSLRKNKKNSKDPNNEDRTSIHTEIYIDTLRDESPAVRKKAVMLLGNLEDKRAIKPLKEVAESDMDSEVRETAKNTLEKLLKL